MRAIFSTGAFLALALLAAGCGKGAAGDNCSTAGSTDECEDTLICDTNKGATQATCLKRCSADTDCGATENCVGVTSQGTIKACKTK